MPTDQPPRRPCPKCGSHNVVGAPVHSVHTVCLACHWQEPHEFWNVRAPIEITAEMVERAIAAERATYASLPPAESDDWTRDCLIRGMRAALAAALGQQEGTT